MGCEYYRCQPKEQAICCLDTMISLTGREIEEHREVLNENGILFGTYTGFYPKEEAERWREKAENTEGGVYIFYSLRELGIDVDDEITVDLVYFTFAPLERKGTIEFCRKKGVPSFAKCPYYDEETARCGIYDRRFYQCRLFPHFRREQIWFGLNPLLEMCQKCNPESCSQVPKKGYRKKGEIVKEELSLREGMRREMEELRKVHKEVLKDYFALLGRRLLAEMTNGNFKVVFETFVRLYMPPIPSIKEVVWGGGAMATLPFPAYYIASLYLHFGWDLEKSVNALDRFYRYAKEKGLIPQAEATKGIASFYKEALKFYPNAKFLLSNEAQKEEWREVVSGFFKTIQLGKK